MIKTQLIDCEQKQDTKNIYILSVNDNHNRIGQLCPLISWLIVTELIEKTENLFNCCNLLMILKGKSIQIVNHNDENQFNHIIVIIITKTTC